jgi:hypothetical protein
VWRLKPERWGSPLVQEKYREGKAPKTNKQTNQIIACFLSQCVSLRIISYWTGLASHTVTRLQDGRPRRHLDFQRVQTGSERNHPLIL